MKILGNIVMLLSCTIMTLSGLPKKKNTCLLMQTVQIFGMAIGNLLLGSLPGCISNVCAGARNVLCYKEKLNPTLKFLTIFISAIISIVFNNIGWFVLFPILATVLATVLIDTKNVVLFKWMLIVCNSFWFVHDFYIEAFVAAVFDILFILTSFIGIVRIKYSNNTKERTFL